MGVHALQPDIYDDETILIIGYGQQYFRQYLIPTKSTGNIIEGKITFPTSTLGFLVNQLSMGMPTRVIGILEIVNKDTQYIKHKEKQGTYKGYVWGDQELGNGQRETQE